MNLVNDLEFIVIISACWLALPAISAGCVGRMDGRGIPSQTVAGFSQPNGLYAGATSVPGGNVGIHESEQRPPPRIGGGPCEYKTYSGTAKIISIHIEELPKGMPGPPHDSYEVKFLFFPNQPIEEAYAQVQGKPQLLTLANSWYPGPQFWRNTALQKAKLSTAA